MLRIRIDSSIPDRQATPVRAGCCRIHEVSCAEQTRRYRAWSSTAAAAATGSRCTSRCSSQTYLTYRAAARAGRHVEAVAARPAEHR